MKRKNVRCRIPFSDAFFLPDRCEIFGGRWMEMNAENTKWFKTRHARRGPTKRRMRSMPQTARALLLSSTLGCDHTTSPTLPFRNM